MVSPVRFGPGVREELDDWGKWTTVYPHYLDTTRTMKGGRRVNKEFAIRLPRISEMEHACVSLGFRYVVEDKCHPRDALVRGRLKVAAAESVPKPTKQQILVSLADTMATNRLLLESSEDHGTTLMSSLAPSGSLMNSVAAVDIMVIKAPPKMLTRQADKCRSKKNRRAVRDKCANADRYKTTPEAQVEAIRARYRQIASGLGLLDIMGLMDDPKPSSSTSSSKPAKKNRK